MLHVASQRIPELRGVFFKYENALFNGMQEKRIHYMCENGIEKSVPWDQALWGQTMILETDFSVPSSQSRWILIILHSQADDGLFFSDFSNLAPVSFFDICKEIRNSSGLYATGPSIQYFMNKKYWPRDQISQVS